MVVKRENNHERKVVAVIVTDEGAGEEGRNGESIVDSG